MFHHLGASIFKRFQRSMKTKEEKISFGERSKQREKGETSEANELLLLLSLSASTPTCIRAALLSYKLRIMIIISLRCRFVLEMAVSRSVTECQRLG